MNPRTLPVKRRPAPNGFFKRIHAVTRNRNQRVATTATAEDLENEDQSSRISRGFTIIFLIHVVAIALYFIHLNFLNDHSVAQPAAAASNETAAVQKPRTEDPPIIAPDDATCMVVAGDNYASIAAREGVDEKALREANKNKAVAAGRTLILPPKRIVAVDSPMVVALRNQTPTNADRGLVEAVPVETKDAKEPSRAQLVHPKVVRETTPSRSVKESSTPKAGKELATTKSAKDKETASAPKSNKQTASTKTTKDTPAPKATPTAAKGSYVVKPGDNLYRISKRYKVDQTALMKANNINDPAKLATGATLVIPH